MGCCGQGRGVWRAGRATPAGSQSAASPVTSPSATRSSAALRPVRLRWRRAVSMSLTGAVSGTAYDVSPEHPVIAVDGRDASGLLATGFFARVG